MLRELRCENYKAFGDETRFPLSSLTVLVGPNNAGKSTALDLVRLTKRYGLNLTSGRGRLRQFDSLLNDGEAEFLKVGRKISAEITLSPRKSDGPTFHIADDISFESTYAPFGNGFLIERRDVFLHPSGERGPAKQRILSKSFEVGPAEEVGAEPGTPFQDVMDMIDKMGDERGEEKNVESNAGSTPDELWFGLPWGSHSRGIRPKDPEKEKDISKPEVMVNPTGPYRRQVSTSYTIDRKLIELAFGIVNTYRRHVFSEKNPSDLSVGAIEFSAGEKVNVASEEEPPPLHAFSTHEYLTDFYRSPGPGPPEWIPSDKEEIWDAVRLSVLAPLIEKINDSFDRMDSTHLPSFRARPERYYGPQDPLTPLLEKYQDAHPTVQDDVEEWLEVFELGYDLDVESVAPDLYAASVRRNGGRRYLADLGSGTAQLLPLILKLTVGNPSSVLLLEEPEANLHPNLQSRLADLLVELIGSGHQVLVETHSEYLVRRLQYLVAKGRCDPDSASVLYVDATDSTDTSTPDVRSISIDEHGQLSEPFGGGFFDEATDLMVDLFKYGSEN
ncbi:DUF3696 domain-containing protein [Salinibacter ruber]|uniref:DUF3696 domain-containing protein n=1 Tax=Salinibacter ruber TaxID=146919 RepID=UPI0020749158|nr:DUF3696 domain-containing protein [Salinibacter ruber]